MNDIERRATVTGIEVRDAGDGKQTVRGHAAVFNQLSEDLGGFREQIAPGAFADAIGSDDVRFLLNHEGLSLARTLAKSLRLSEDTRGLAFEADVNPEDPDWQRLMPKLVRGDISQMSFGFSVRPGGQDWAKDDEGRTIRTLKKVRLIDVSPVTYPAYPQTDIAVRELRAWEQAQAPGAPMNLVHARNQQARI